MYVHFPFLKPPASENTQAWIDGKPLAHVEGFVGYKTRHGRRRWLRRAGVALGFTSYVAALALIGLAVEWLAGSGLP